MDSVPASLTAATGMDALTHAVANGDNMEVRDQMVYAEFLAGMAFNNASLGYVRINIVNSYHTVYVMLYCLQQLKNLMLKLLLLV